MLSKALAIRAVGVGLGGLALAALLLSVLAVWLIVTEPVALAAALHARDIRPVWRVLMR